jgi:hypothetical protein
MTTLQIISLVAQIQIGTRIQAGKSILRVVSIKNNRFDCVNEYAESKGYDSQCFISFENFDNHHYNKNYKILN